MNERIRQLAKQANTIGDWGEDITEGRYFVYPNIKNLEKFAELILMDVLDICEELGDKGQDGHYCVDKIRRVFGV